MSSLTPRSLAAYIRARIHSAMTRLNNQLKSDQIGREINAELRFHLEERTDELIASGMSPHEAQYEARRKFGNLGAQQEQTRERKLFAWFDSLLADARYAARALRKAPAFALVAVLSLAVGIGANTAVFSVLNAVLLKSLPVSHPEELIGVVRDDRNQFTNPLWEAIRGQQQVFDGVFAFGRIDFNLSTAGESRRVPGNFVSGDFFRTLGVRTVAGRALTREDDVRGCPATAVISSGFWQSEFGGSPSAIGKTISLEGNPFVVVGVTEPSFFGMNVGVNPKVYVPLCSRDIISRTSLDDRSSWYLQIVGRPKSGLDLAQVKAGLAARARAIAELSVPSNFNAAGTQSFLDAKFDLEPASLGLGDVRKSYSKALYVLMTIVGLVLLVACANVANLLLARATARQREIAVRLALGARKLRIARQLLTESLMLSLCGGALGIVFANWGSQLLVTLISRRDQVTSLDLSIDARLLLFSITASVLTGVLFGLAPIWQASRTGVHGVLKANGRSVAEGQSRFSSAKVLVAAQVSLSLVLLSAAGLLLGSWRRLDTVDPGFRRDNTLVIRADIRRARIPADQRQSVVDRTLQDLRALPGATHAAVASYVYLDRETRNGVLLVDGFTPAKSRDALAWVNLVSDRYFESVGVPIKSGRDFAVSDVPGSPKVAIVSEATARLFFHRTDVLGRTFRVEQGPKSTEPYEIVGVVGDTRFRSLSEASPALVYFPRAQEEPASQSVRFIVHTSSINTILPAAKDVLARNIPQAILDVTTIDRQVDESMRMTLAMARLSGFFGAIALLLAAMGLYGIMAYGVARRKNEIGVRLALGASQSRVVRMVLSDVGRIVIAGVAVGIVLSFGLTKLVVSFLYEVKPNDPATLTAAALMLIAVGLGAAAVPAWRAARLNPVSALRED